MPRKPPPNGVKFQKGQSGNPLGKPKGIRDRKTIIKQWLDVVTDTKNPLSGKKEKLTQEDLIVIAQVLRAQKKADPKSFELLMDSRHGKLETKNSHSFTPSAKFKEELGSILGNDYTPPDDSDEEGTSTE
jgi:hypothetical protein